jgi:hypothetical protein
MSYFDDASLVFIPSGTKTSKAYSVKPIDGTGDLTFTRSNDTATRVASNGLIERVRTNLILQSNSFDTTWALSNATATSGQTGYDGTSDAWLFETTIAGAEIHQSISSTGILTYSVYAKAGSVNGIRLRIDAATDGNGYFDLSDGTIFLLEGISASIVGVGGGWYRCSVSQNTSSPLKVQFFTTDGTTSYDNGTIYIQDAQLETGDIATDYIATTSAAVSVGPVANVPRLDYLGSSCPRLLLEPQRTNTSYIPTLGAAVTRGVEQYDKVITSLVPDATTFTWEVDFIVPEVAAGGGEIFGRNAAGTIQLRLYANNGGAVRFRVESGGQNYDTAVSVGDTAKCIFRCSSGVVSAFYNGVKIHTFTGVTMDFGKIQFGQPQTSPKIIRSLVFPTALTDAQCIELTA